AVGVGARLVLAALAVGEDDLRVGDGLGVRGDVAGDLGDRRPAVPDDGDVGLLDPVALSAGVELELALLLLALGQIGFGGRGEDELNLALLVRLHAGAGGLGDVGPRALAFLHV